MPTHSDSPSPLPERPDLRPLRLEAKALLKSGAAASLAEAYFALAKKYGFPSWPKLKVHVESLREIGQLRDTISANDLQTVKALMTANPALHRAPLGYGKSGPLTWTAECRGPASPPTPERLAIAAWMLDNDSDIHQGGDGPLCRAALMTTRIPMMELLVSRGADVNALWQHRSPIIFGTCETVQPGALRWLIEHGAKANTARGSALNYLLGGYVRSAQLGECIDILVAAGAQTDILPIVIDIMRGRSDSLPAALNADPGLIQRQFDNLDIGATGARRLTLKACTLLHVAAEFGNVEAAKILLHRGADPNTRGGAGAHTPIYHAVTQFNDWGLPVAKLLLENGADLQIRATVPGHYERADEILECTPLGYAMRFPEGPDNACRDLLRRQGGVE